jgi:hypothetical protein
MIYDEGDFTQDPNTASISFKPISFVTGNTVGVHWIIPGTFLSDDFNISYGLGLLNVVKAPLTIKIDNLSKTYGSSDPAFTYKITGGELFGNDFLTGSPLRQEGESAGVYQIEKGSLSAGPSYNLNIVNGTFTIEKANLSVKANDQIILAGDPLPAITFTYSGLVSGDTPSGVFGNGPTYQINPQYTGAAGVYQIIPVATADNYNVSLVAGSLYVNPSGSGAKAIRPILTCIEQVSANGYTYIAHFKYENKNSTDIYIPIGPDNSITGKGSFSTVNQPQLFKAGGGAFDVPFDGQKIVWQVTSIESGRKASAASEASSTSSKCPGKTSKALTSLDTDLVLSDDKALDAEFVSEMPVVNSSVYPNPVTDKVTIEFNGLTEKSRITIMDLSGRSYPVKKLTQYNNHLELDLGSLSPGIYIVIISDDLFTHQFRVIKN